MESGNTSVELSGVSKRFADITAVDNLSLELAEGEFFTMLGPSGCGKTTTLRMIGGFEQPTEGTVRIAGEDVSGLPAAQAPDQHRLPELRAVPPHERRGQRRLRAAPAGRAEGGDRGQGRLRVDTGRALARGETPPRPALRRPAAAGRAGQGPGQPAEGAAPRRAARRPRPETAQGAPGRAEADPARRRDHLRLRHPRPGGGADDERPDRGDEPRPGRTGRRPRDRLRPAGDHLRRRLHRRLEPDAGQGHRRR